MPDYDELCDAMKDALNVLGDIPEDPPEVWDTVNNAIQEAHDILDDILGDVGQGES